MLKTKTKQELKINDKAPNLNIPDQDNNIVDLKDYQGKWIVLFFYPKDNTPGCTTENIEFSQNIEYFKELNTELIGVSPDSIKSHCNFINKHSLVLRLLSDTDLKVSTSYGVWQLKKNFGKEYEGIVRTTFIIDAEGKIRKIFKNVKVKGHVDQIKTELKELLAL